jgi:electron transfer DM13
MADTMPDTRASTNTTMGNADAMPAPNQPLLYSSLAAGIALAIVLVALFPNLLSSPPNLALVVLSPILGSLVVGLLVSRVGRRLPGQTENVVRVAFLLLLLLDAWVYIGPLFVRGGTANDSAPTFNTALTNTLTGQFDHKNDPAHSVSGTAILGTTTGGKPVLRLQDFNTTNGPDLYVYLSKVATPTSSQQVHDGLEVAKLTATEGNLNYTLPSGADIGQYKSAVIYCKSFSVIFGFANLAAPGQAAATATPAPRALTGQFDHKNDPNHSVSGTVTLGTTTEGKVVLQFSDFKSTNGPDLYVYLSREASPTKSTQVMNGLEVSKLKATQTAPRAVSTYELPAGTDASQFKSAVIYCKSFSVIFGFANLS